MKEINVNIGKRIRSKREYMKYTREQLAEMVEISPPKAPMAPPMPTKRAVPSSSF